MIIQIFKTMPGGRIMMIIFFASVLFAGLTSLINLFETPIATLQEKMKISHKKPVAVITVIGISVGVTIQGIVGGWMDAVSIYVCPLGAFIAGVMFFWVFGSDYARRQLQKGRKKLIGAWLEPMTRYVFCGLTLLVLLLSCLIPGGIG